MIRTVRRTSSPSNRATDKMSVVPLLTTHYSLLTNHEPRTTNYELRTTNYEPLNPHEQLPIPILADRPAARPPRYGHLHIAAHAGMHDSASGVRTNLVSASQRLYLPSERRSFAELPDHDAGQGLPVFPVAEASGEAPASHHAHQRSASPGKPQPSSQLHQHLADRRKTRPYGPQHHLVGPEDGRSHSSAHPRRVDGGGYHAGLPRLDCGRHQAPTDASLQRDLRVHVSSTERGHRRPAKGIPSQSQRPRRQPSGSAPS